MKQNSKVVFVHGQKIRMWPTDWQFRRSTGDDLDFDLYHRIAPPGHFILFKNDSDGHLSAQRPVEYISRTEGLGPHISDKGIRTYYLVSEDIVWCGSYKVQKSNIE